MKNRLRMGVLGLTLTLVLAGPVSAQTPARVTAPDTSWVARSVLYEVFVQDFSSRGDLRGVMEGLDQIQSAGANTIWLMPIHPLGVLKRKEPLGSPYAVRDFRAINPAYGNEEDFHALVQAAHARGMKLILDWVPDHTAWDHSWVTQHPDFYVHNDRGELSVPLDPGGKPTDWTDVVQLDYKNPELRQTMIATMRYWLEQFGIDGFRMDVAGFVPIDFWREAIPILRSAVPRPIVLLAEWGDLEMHRAGFDLTYAWDSYSRLKSVWKGAPASSFVQRELAELQGMPPGGMRLRFTTNHDETAWDNPPVTIFGGSPGARAAYVAMALLPGRPLLYNGQEVESPQKLPLFQRDTVVWGQPQADAARRFYRNVLQMAETNRSLIAGDFQEIETSAPDDVIAYQRADLVVLVNARSRAVRIVTPKVKLAGTQDLLTDRTQRSDTLNLPAYGAMVLRRRGN